ncbi:hypothetical protein V6N12_027757 [Hibiscus sabdariffa]|uniref:Leucine-rich repeat-containing N-terminal plant-type domain-containing protein n=1 Tax=Hibiscus sabdariffa TaxID=183260 RepID=A0ABR2F3T9_9ROSI
MMELKWVWFLRISVMSVLLVLGDACLEHERIALLQLKPFFNHYNELADWDEVKGSDCCRWRGIECNTATTNRLIGLSLNSTRYKDEGWYLNASLFLPFVELKSLYLRGNAIAGCIQNEGFEKLSSVLSNLEILHLGRNHLNDSIMLSLRELSSLRYLNLAENRPEASNHPNGFQWFSRLGNLETLDLSGNGMMKNNILFHMSGLSSLKFLSLSSCLLEEHLLHIQELNNLTKLRYLDLNNNNGIESISNQDGKQLKLINLEQLDLSYNQFRNDTFSFPKGLSSLKSLIMRYNNLQGSLDMKGLNYLTNLKHLDLSSNRIESISTQGLPSLKSLSMASNDLQGSLDVKELINLTNLKKLDLSNNHIESLQSSEDDGKKLQHLSRLEELNLDGNLLNNSVFASLNGFSNLKSLHISGNQLKGSLDLDAFSSLRELYVRGNQLRDFVSHKGLCGLKNLEVLDVSLNAIEGILPHCFGNLTSLRKLDISYNQFSGNLTPLTNLTSLEYISLSRNHFQIPMSFLAHFPNLQFLLIDENRMLMEPSFYTSVSKFQLKVISMSKCITSQELGPKLPTFLYYQYDLRYVDLSENSFSGTVPMWLLENNTKLEYLILRGNAFSGPLSLPSAPNFKVSTIDISDNRLQGQVPSSICSSFPYLGGLFLSENLIEGNIPPCLGGMKELLV